MDVSQGLLDLNDELLHKIMLAAGAPSVARAATLCRRLRGAQQQLAALPAFASAACLDEEQELEACVRSAVLEAREQMPATADACLLFVGGLARGRGRDADPLSTLVPLCRELLPPGTVVVGCCGRGVYGVQGGQGVELDPVQQGVSGASVLLARLPGSLVHPFAAHEAPDGGWESEEACREWLGLVGAAAPAGKAAGAGNEDGAAPARGLAGVQPLLCLLFAHSSVGGDLHECVDGLQAAFPGMVLTGGVSSGMGELFCSQALPQPAEEEGAAKHAADGPGGGSSGGRQASKKAAAALRPRYTGLLMCRPTPQQQQQGEVSAGEPAVGAAGGGGGGAKFFGGGLASQGMEGGDPVLTRLVLTREFGILQHPHNSHGQPDEMELLGLSGARTAHGADATPLLRLLATRQAELGLWAAPKGDEPGSFDGAVAAGQRVVVLQLYGVVEEAEALGTANDDDALDAVLEAAEQQGAMLCAQPLKLSPEGARATLEASVARLAAAVPAPHALLPTTNCGLVAVSCTAKGQQMYGAAGVEAGVIRAASGRMPLAGVYCDGEIGPEILDGKCTVRWAGGDAGGSGSGGQGSAQPVAPRSRLQGFTTIIAALTCSK